MTVVTEGTRVNHLEEDSKVEVHGLVSQTALNGRRGTVVGMRNKQGRWPVVLDPATTSSQSAAASGASVSTSHSHSSGTAMATATTVTPFSFEDPGMPSPARGSKSPFNFGGAGDDGKPHQFGARPPPSTPAATGGTGGDGSATTARRRWWMKPETLHVLLPCSALCGVIKRAGVKGELKQCGKCHRARYCSVACQRGHWKTHKKVCAAPVDCVICMDCEGFPLPIQTGCACRGEAAWAHVACKVQVAEHHSPGQWNKAWDTCLTCKQRYKGMFALRLAREGLRRFAGRPPEDDDRLCAQDIVASALGGLGRREEALTMRREVLAVRERVFGKDHPDTLTATCNLAVSLYELRKHQEARTLLKSLLARQRAHCNFGEEHERTLWTASLLANCLGAQGKHAEAAELQTATLATQRRVLGEEHVHTLKTAIGLGQILGILGKHDEAVALLRDTHARSRRVLGRDHEDTLEVALFLGRVLMYNPNAGDTAEGRALITEALERARHVLGPRHSQLQSWKKSYSQNLHSAKCMST